MVTGWDRGFIIERDKSKRRKRFDCRLCSYFDSSDSSCNKKGVYLPEIGYDIWKGCNSLKYEPNCIYSDMHIRQLCKAGKSKNIVGISIEDIDIYFDKNGYQVGDFKKINDEYKVLFERASKSDRFIKDYLVHFVPIELHEGYVKLLKNQDNELYYKVVAAFLILIGMNNPRPKAVRQVCRNFNEYYINKMIKGTCIRMDSYNLACEFIEFFSEMLEKKRVYETNSRIVME